MAIDKPGMPKAEWTPTALIFFGVSGVLALAGLLLGWLAFGNWRYRSDLRSGLRQYAEGRGGAARGDLKSALARRPGDVASRELLAKLACDAGELDEAERHYRALRAQGHASPTVAVGLGVVALKQAMRLQDPKAFDARLKEAAGEFTGVKGRAPEADLGLAHAALLQAERSSDGAALQQARSAFEQIRASVEGKAEYRSAMTLDGLIDYQAGLGKALASGPAHDPGAAAAYRAAHQYDREWLKPLANALLAEAKRFKDLDLGREALGALKAELNAVKNDVGAIIRAKRPAREVIGEAWMQFNLALASAWGRAGVYAEAQPLLRDVSSMGGFEARLEPHLLDLLIRSEQARREDLPGADQERNVGLAAQGYGEFQRRLGADPEKAELRATVLNNLAWMLTWRGVYSNSSAFHTQAFDRLKEALAILPDDPVLHRNLCLVLRRLKRPPASWAEHFAKVKAWNPPDLDALTKYLESP
jgi:hypothetical protein